MITHVGSFAAAKKWLATLVFMLLYRSALAPIFL